MCFEFIFSPSGHNLCGFAFFVGENGAFHLHFSIGCHHQSHYISTVFLRNISRKQFLQPIIANRHIHSIFLHIHTQRINTIIQINIRANNLLLHKHHFLVFHLVKGHFHLSLITHFIVRVSVISRHF